MTEKVGAARERELLKREAVNIIPVRDISQIPQRIKDFFGKSRWDTPDSEWFIAAVGDDNFYMIKSRPERELDELFLAQEQSGKSIGYAILQKGKNPLYGPNGKPFTRFTKTESTERLGSGMRRMRVLDSYAVKVYGEHLHSGTHLEPEAKGMWEKLVAEDLAEPITIDGHNVFRIKSDV